MYVGKAECGVDRHNLVRNEGESFRLNEGQLYRIMSVARSTTWPTCEFRRWLVLPTVAVKGIDHR